MNRAQKIILLVLVVLLAATIYGLVRTGVETVTAPGKNGAQAGSQQNALVDQTPLLTAQSLAHEPTTPAELPFAQDALRVGDQQMDLAFALALADATQNPPALSADAKQIELRLQKAEDALAETQAQVTRLTAAQAKATGSLQDSLGDQLSLANAQLELRQDEVDDAKQDLLGAGGDPQDRIQELVDEHEAASKISDATKVTVVAEVQPRGLIQRYQQWSALHKKQLQLWSARQNAASAAATLAARHNALQQQTGESHAQPGAATNTPPESATNTNAPEKNPAIAGTTAKQPVVPASHAESATLLAATKRRAASTKILSTLDKEGANERQLDGIYSQWIGVVAARQRSLINAELASALFVVGIGIIGLFIDDGMEHLLARMSSDRRQVATLRSATRVSLQIIGFLFILLAIFGPPTQLGAILGLVGAGLTIAMQDFIVAFFGRFVLMGKNGIRLGDWVEINGVTGEVAELGMFHTVLLETGNWTDSGHPTGRRVTFTNSFAVQGHYFNFSTSGQWLWDELQIAIPAGQNPYPILDAIQKQVVAATSESAQQAEHEWHDTSGSGAMDNLSAAPSINVKPVGGGVEISVRYITRASQRAELRAKLNRAAVDLLGAEFVPRTASDSKNGAPPMDGRGDGKQDAATPVHPTATSR